MKRSLAKNSLIALLLVIVTMLAAVGCNFGSNTTTTTTVKNDPPVVEGADKTALNAELALEVTEQGDYTSDSYDAYNQKFTAAHAVANDEDATQDEVDVALAALLAAREALTVRTPVEAEGCSKSFRMISGQTEDVLWMNYVDTKGLSSITYDVKVSNAVLSISEITDGFKMTAGAVNGTTDVIVTITTKYNGDIKLTVELTVTITNDVSPVLKNETVEENKDVFYLTDKESLVIDFASNVTNTGNLPLSYTVNGETIEGSTYTVVLSGLTDEYIYTTYTVTVTYTANGEQGTLTYTYKLGLRDTSAYRVANGNFDNGLAGWTLNNTSGDAPFAGIDEKTTFWGEGYPMFNVGKYFSSYADGASEASQGTLASPYFTVKSAYATYMLGGAGNHNVYITVEDKDGNVLALYRNTQFRDHTAEEQQLSVEEKKAMIGNTVFLANFVTYKVDMSAFAGKEVRFVIHDYASSGWGVVFFDELNTYCEEVPETAVLAENLLASKDALSAELANKVTEQGDYTADSYNAYVEKLNAAKALVNDIAVTQATVDAAVEALKAAREALAVRPVEAVADANKSFALVSGNGKEITLSDYVNTNNLSNITYNVTANNPIITVGGIADGKLTITAGEVSEATDVTVTISVYYNGEEKLTVELAVSVTNDVAPKLFNTEVAKSYDIYDLTDKSSLVLDFGANVDNAGSLALTYSVNGNLIEGSTYTVALGSYTDEYTTTTYTVTVTYTANGVEGKLEYTYTLGLRDTTAYRLTNGGFESGLDGWTQVGNIGGVSSEKTYWNEGIEFGMDGDNMFSAYVEGALESAVGTLTSSTFTVGGSGFVTFKVGAMRDGNYVYVDVVDAETKQILARYYNGSWVETDLSGCKLVAYKADLSAFDGKEVFFRISDNADSGYGLFFADSFVTYYESEPEGFNEATKVNYEVSGTIYDVFNGGFEMGNVQGWWNVGEIGLVTNATGYWGDNIAYGKDGEYLFTGVESYGADTMREGNMGSLTSSTFVIGGTGWISFKLGGGGNEHCYVQILDVATGEVLARFRQQAQQDAVLIQYVADLSAHIGKTVRFQVVDYATSGWGCVSFDNLVTYYASTDALPEGIAANNYFAGVYEVTNGSFEDGLNGWTMNITEAGNHNTLGWVLDTEINADWYTQNGDDRKDGDYLFTFATPNDDNCENTKGELVSSTFTLKQNTYVSFRFGGAGTREVHVQLVRADGTVIATFYNEAEGKVNTEMYAYYYQYTGETADCYFRVVDNSTSSYGCFVVDDFRANLESAPEGFIAAIQ